MSLTPLVRRHLLEPAWSLFTGAHVLNAERELERSQYCSESEHRARQLTQVQQLLCFVLEHNAFYRDRLTQAGIAADSIRSLEDLRRIPILTKREVRDHGRALLSTGFDSSSLISAKTGGSTGKPIELFFTEEVSQLRNASGRRNKRWAGWNAGEATGAVWGNPIFPETVRERLREWVLAPVTSLDTMSITSESVRAFAARWRRLRPTLLFGHAHSVFLLASIVDDLRITDIQPHAIIASSMMLLPHERAVIERVFGTRVTDIYGCEEVGLIAGECERHEGLHMNMEQLIVEILRDDGTPATPGEPGLVVVTDLLNRAMPFIRYRMEDMAELSDRPCTCGRGFPMLRRIVGRTADFLKRADGSRVAGISLIENTLTHIPGVEQMQIVQPSLLHIQVRVVPGAEYTTENRERFADYFRGTFPGATIEVTEVSAIQQEANGKYRFSICQVAD